MKIIDVINKIESYAPIELALDFDNSGMNVGNINDILKGIVIAVDVTIECVQKAIDCNANLIISHHPIIFNPIKNILHGDMVSDIVTLAIKNNINLYSCHTNMDNAPKGINYRLAKLLGGLGVKSLCEDGSGIITYVLPTEFKEICAKVAMFDNTARYYGANKAINKIAIISGSGGRDKSLPKLCNSLGADVFISAELKHNLINEFIYNGVNIIECSHYNSEKIFIDIIKEILINMENMKLTEFYSDLFNNKI